jgi:pimeloyl-ACP methyl ester carboxylesterase
LTLRLLALALLLSAGCVHRVAERCPSCTVVDGKRALSPALKPDTRRLFVLVPGELGYGWEWDDAVASLRRSAETDFVVFWWNPGASFERATHDLTSTLDRLLVAEPARLEEIVVVAHSAAGLFAAQASARLHVPPGRRITIVTIGAPFSGMHAMPYSSEETPHSPTFFTIVGNFSHYAPPVPGVEFIEYVTSFPEDPVMQPHGGHDPADPKIGPAGRKRIELGHADHNTVVAKVVKDLLKEYDPR